MASAAKESSRQQTADDREFLQEGVYIFELRLEDKHAGMIPLIINPEQESMDEGFTVELTPGVNGHLYAEENGMIMREIRISGTTGFKPRRFPDLTGKLLVSAGSDFGKTPAGGQVNIDAEKSFLRHFTPVLNQPLSGQRHFQILQDKIFRRYADLKRNPTTAKTVAMFFHVTKDRESWLVVPRQFSMSRGAGQERFLYRYDIRLTAVGPATLRVEQVRVAYEPTIRAIVGPVRSVLSTAVQKVEAVLEDLVGVKAAIRDVRKAFDTVRGWIDIVNKAIGKVNQFIRDVKHLVFEVIDFVRDVNDFITGIGKLLATPFDVVAGLVTAVDDVITGLDTSVRGLYDQPAAAFRRLGWVLNETMVRREAYFRDGVEALKDFFGRSPAPRPLFAFPDSVLTRGNAGIERGLQGADPASSLRGLSQGGTSNVPGDPRRSGFETSSRGLAPSYSSLRAVVVESGDTIQSIAARELGDPQRWSEIAAVNQLSEPFIMEEQRLPNTLTVGDTILIPSDRPTPGAIQQRATLGVAPDAPFIEHYLGRDYTLKERSGLPQNRFDWVISASGIDFQTVASVPNLQQGLRTRILTHRGEIPLYPNLGTDIVIGTANRSANRAMLSLSIVRSVEEDPRIGDTGNVQLLDEGADVVSVEFDAFVRGFTDRRTLTVEV